MKIQKNNFNFGLGEISTSKGHNEVFLKIIKKLNL